MDSYWESGSRLSNDTKIIPQVGGPNLIPSLIWGLKTCNNREKFDYHLSNDKTVLCSFSDQQLPAAKFFVHRFRR